MTSSPSSRPDLSAGLTEEEFLRWYWLKDELAGFARERGIRATGGKDLLSARIAAALGGREFVEPEPARLTNGRQLAGEISATTVIPAGQRSSQLVRAWMTEHIGSGFHFDAEMREFFSRSDGTKTMQDAVDHWHATRGLGARSIDDQFEYNRFTRAWHERHPTGSRDELVAAWRDYRNSPVDERGRA